MRVKSSAELDAALAQAKGKTVMLDFYADWCVSCKEMEKLTFSDPRIQAQFGNMVLLQADVTANNADDKALLKRFRLFGPPGIIFFNKEGREIQGGRVIGYQNADRFLRSLTLANSF
jgi:thiol:disulfide interchange protein DsbD